MFFLLPVGKLQVLSNLHRHRFLLRHGPCTWWVTIGWKVVLLLWQSKHRTVTASLHCTRMSRICIYFLKTKKGFRGSSTCQFHKLTRCSSVNDITSLRFFFFCIPVYYTCLPNILVYRFSALFKSIFRLVEWL